VIFGLRSLRLIRIIYIIGLFLALFTLLSCENDVEKINFLTGKKLVPLESTRNITLIFSDSGHVTARLISPLVERYEGDSSFVEFKEGLKLEFFNNQKQVESRLTAKYAIKYNRSGIMEAKNKVEVLNQKGEVLNCEHLVWNQSTHQIYSNTFVKIKTVDEIIFGDGFESNEDFSKYKIKKIRGTINLKDDEIN
jgi:LPS export ABC transporter protein LptC